MTILLLGDLTGRSRVALRMLTGELENRGHEVLALPTALISNTLNLGRAAIADTTDYLLEALETWETLGLSYDLLYIGYVTGLAQAEKLCRVADAARARGVPVVVDPILGDHGRRYNSVSVEQAEAMARLIRHADIITPNLTEACLMTGQPYENADVDALLDALGGAQTSVLVTSAGDAVAGKDARTGAFASRSGGFPASTGARATASARCCWMRWPAGFRSNRRPGAPATGCMKPF